ncbi:hypothetical protein KY348_02080 [Candidatus Woesearchaeota archaeon]|nr:hypothetical protein [Candidatus Woesearchaeota archaeon]
MDFDKFLERDIIEFLDEQTMKVAEKAAGLREEEFDLYEITQDYSKEINEALKEGDLRKARKVFEEVKNKYIKAPETSLSKKRFYIIMEEIYQRIKDYEAKEEGKKSLFETIKEYEATGLFTKPELLKERETQRVSIILSSINRKEKKLEKITSQRPLRPEDFREAIKTYREVKELIRRIPNTYAKDKSRAYGSALSWYYTLKKLKQGFGDKKIFEKEKKARKREPVEKKLEEIRRFKQEIIKSHTKIAGYLKNKELVKSMEEYRHLKELCEHLPIEMEEEKTALLADALSLYESIKKMKKSLDEKQARLFAEKKEGRIEAGREEEIKNKIWAKLRTIRALLEKKDAYNAIGEYRELKEIFNQYPEHFFEEKNRFYQEILGAHKDIKQLENELKEKTEPRGRIESADINTALGEIHALLDKGSAEQATHKLLEIKHRIQMLPKENFDEKYKLLKEVEKLEHKLVFVKNINNIDTPNVITGK